MLEGRKIFKNLATVKNFRKVLLVALFLLLTTPQFLQSIYAADIWKALYSGRYLTLFHQFPHHSTFTFLPVKDFLTRNSYNWFGNLFFYNLYFLFGFPGLQSLRVVVAGLSILMMASMARYRFNPLFVLLSVLFVWGINQKLVLRTAIVAVPATTCLLWIWYKTHLETKTKWIYVTPVLFVTWSSFHGSYIIGLLLLVLILCGRVLNILLTSNTDLESLNRLALITLFSIGICGIIKPFPNSMSLNLAQGTWRSIVHETNLLFKEESGIRSEGSEESKTLMQSIQNFKQDVHRSQEFSSPLKNIQFLFVKVSMLIAIIFFLLLPFQSKFDWEIVTVSVPIVLIGMLYLRTMGYIPLILIPTILVISQDKRISKWLKSPTVRNACFVILIALSFFVGYFLLTGNPDQITGSVYSQLELGPHPKYSVGMASYVLRKYPNQRLINSYNIGSFLAWEWWPFKRILIDTKSSAFKKKVWETYHNVGLAGFTDKYDLSLAIVEIIPLPNGNAFVPGPFYRNPNWKLIGRHGRMMLFRRNPSTQ